jgi:hypothetical protein
MRALPQVFAAACLAAAACVAAGAAQAQSMFLYDVSAVRRLPGATHFVDFRARPGVMLGHTFIVYGRLDARGRPYDLHYAGLYPKSGDKQIVILTPRAAIMGGVKDDISKAPSVIYRRPLSAAEYRRMLAKINRVRATEPYWNLLFFNCNDFAVEVAESLDMAWPWPWLLPKDFVAGLATLNGG